MSWNNKKFWAEYQGKAIALIPKSGNTSFSRLAGRRLSVEEALQFDTRVMFIREPIKERFVSNFSMFKVLNDEGGHKDVPREATETYEAFVDFALATPNAHWAPQTLITGGIATHIHRFDCDSIRKWWPVYWPGRQPDWLNSFSHLPTNDYRINDLKAYYAEDLCVYEAAT